MSTAPQNVAIVMVFLALGGVVLLAVAPFELGTIRLAGVSLFWWYGVIAAPVFVVTVTAAALVRAARRRDTGVDDTRSRAVDTPVPTAE